MPEFDFAEWIVVRLLALGVLVLFPRRRVVAGVAAVVAIAATTKLGHGAVSLGAWGATTLHAGVAVISLAGLGVLLTAMLGRRLCTADLERLRHWSPVAMLSVVVLMVTGLWRAWVEVGFPEAIWATYYGRVLLLKAVTVLLALGLASLAVRWLHRQPRAGAPPAPGDTRALRRRVGIETATVTLATLLAMVLSNLTPGSVAYRPAATLRAHLGHSTAEIHVEPARTGTELVAVTVYPNGESGSSALAVTALSGVLRENGRPSGTVVPVRFPIRITYPAPPGQTPAVIFRSAAVTVPHPGDWTLDLTVAADVWTQYTARVRYRVR